MMILTAPPPQVLSPAARLWPSVVDDDARSGHTALSPPTLARSHIEASSDSVAMKLAVRVCSLTLFRDVVPALTWKHLYSAPRNVIRTFAKKNNERRRRRSRNMSKGPTLIGEEASSGSGENATTILQVNDDDDVTSDDKAAGSPRSAVLQACTLTSGLLLAVGLVLREASHFASLDGWPFADSSVVSFNFETWHLELVAGLVILISSSRYILLQTWPDFRDSSEAANTQILTSLEPLDYIVVACLPGISEEFLFRGVLMPIFGLNWISALVTGALFGVLHLGNGRRYSFAIWATFVGLAYGLATIASSSIIVPMASHSINNIIGGLLWRFTNNSEREM